MTDFAWVIEHRLSPTHSPYYWAGNGWSVEHMKAIRFARKEDAERTRAGFDDEFALEHRVAEHGWDNGDGDGCTGTDRLELQVPPSADLGQRLAGLYYRAFHALNRARARRQQVSPDQQGEKP